MLLILPATCLEAFLPTTPVQLAEDHSPVDLAILFFSGPIMPQDRKEFCEPTIRHHPGPYTKSQGRKVVVGGAAP